MEIFIHCYCKNDYGRVLIQKFKRIRMSGLLDAVEKITISVSNFREIDAKFFEDYKKLSPKIHVNILKDIVIGDECDTLNYIKKYAENFEQNKPILYIHTKGVSQIHSILKKNIELWSKYMDYWCIWNWNKNVEMLKDYDTCGGMFYGNHYCGNFYWVNSVYLKTLPYITKELHPKINRGEFWIGCNNKLKAYDINTIKFPEGHDFYMDHYIAPDVFPQGF